MKKDKKSKASATGFVLLLYLIVMLWLLLGQRIYPGMELRFTAPQPERCNLQPFQTILWYLNLHKLTGDRNLLLHGWVNLVGNVVLFIPLGLLLPRVFPPLRKFWKFLFCVTLSVVLVEVVQLLTGLGSCDIDDLILNLFGALVGYLFRRRKTK